MSNFEVVGRLPSVVFRARHDGDGQPFIIKQLRDDHPSRGEMPSLKQEYAILKSLALPEVANAIALEPVGNSLALIMDDGVGEPSFAKLRIS